MIVLLPVYEFEIKEFEESKSIKGFYRDLNSKEIKDLEKKNKEYNDAIKKGIDLEKRLKRAIEQLEISTRKENWEKVEELTNTKYELEDALSALAEKTKPEDKENDILKWKMNICLTGDDKEKIIALAESYGYLKVQKTIFEAVQEKKQEK